MSETNRGGLLTVSEAADQLRISRASMYRLIESGDTPALQIGGSIRVDPVQLARWAYGNTYETRGRDGG
jgi:excisionase family DNA binding protein